MKRNHIDIITLGCSKNLVDSEMLMKQLEANGFRCEHDAEKPQGDIAVINTCGFIGDAKEESINTILSFAQAKQEGRLRRLYVMGCLSQRYMKELAEEIPEVDGFYGKFDYRQVVKDLRRDAIAVCNYERVLTTPTHYAYLKIAEGCDRRCSYCAIPLITGHHVSRPMDEIVEEVAWLAAQGVSEFQVIEQELTYYGVDIDGKPHIAELVERIAHVPGVRWIRLHYAYPNNFPYELLDVMNRNDNVCKYLDIALQHISDHILEDMHRHVTRQECIDLIAEIRRRVPGICLRTTLMVGFPGETDADFEELMEFVKTARFERMGAFAYSEEEGTYSATHFRDNVPEEIKHQRLDRLMALQQTISAEITAQQVGKTMTVVIDRQEGDYYVGRTEYSSPEVDPEVLIPSEQKQLTIGAFYQVEMTDAEEFDLYGRVVS